MQKATQYKVDSLVGEDAGLHFTWLIQGKQGESL